MGLLGIDRPVRGQTAPPSPPWPHTLTINGSQVIVYQPQAIDWPDHAILSTREAIAITPPGQTTPILGTTEIAFATQTDAATGNVILSDPQLKASHFPALDTARAAQVEQQIKAALPDVHPQPVALQSVLLSLKDTGQPQNIAINNDPPAIFYSAKPASLVVFDGEPVLAPIGTTGLSSVVNTNWDVFTDGQGWYLLNNGSWMAAPASSGPYQPVAKLPPAFASLPADPNFAAVRKEIPPKPAKPGQAPVIFVSTKPADIIVTNGPPQFVPVQGTGLQAVKNTTSTVFFEPTSGRYFVLISGRWFASHGFDGPWTFATNDLPPDFALIPPNDPQAAVLASVPGTAQAQQALLQAQVPRQATLKKDAAKLTVVYAGPPQFKPIPGTPMTYAVNTSFQVIGLNGHYYVCHQGAWFEGPSPSGPWVLASSIPQVIYTIPPASPMYNVTYVKVYAATPTTVTYGYTAGYMMGFVTAGVLVYGTGYYYPPVVIPGPVPIYYPYPYSYVGPVAYNTANGAWVQGGAIYGPNGGVARGGTYYNPNNGAHGAGGAIYGPNGGAGAFSYYNPSTGGYAHGSASWSNGYGAANASYYNPRTGVTGSTNQNVNPYERYGSSTLSGPNQTVNTASGSNSRGSAGGFQSSTGAEGAGYRGANGNSGGAVKTQNGDVYAGHDGNAYKHTSDGWSKWDNGGWQPVNPPTNNNNNNRNTNTTTNNRNNTTNNRNNSLGGSQSTSPSANRNSYKAQPSNQRAGQTQRSSRPSMENSSYQQLEQDRRARTAGNGQLGGFRGGGYGGGGFGGGRFGGGGGGGGGRFRR